MEGIVLPVIIALSIVAWLISGYGSFRLFRYRWRYVRCWTPQFTARSLRARVLLGPMGLIPEVVLWCLGTND